MPVRVSLTLVLLAVAPLSAQRGYPRIETIYPGAVARGASTEVLLTGRYNLRDSVRVVFDRPGVTAAVGEWRDLADPSIPAEKRKPFERESLRIQVSVDAGAMPGIYPFRILTKGSLSASAHLLVAPGACLNEAEPNNAPAQAQTLEPGLTVNGRLEPDADLDVYRINAAAGDSVAFLAYASRLQRPVPQLERDFSDLTLSLRDAKGVELASADDSLTEDPELFHEFQQAGVYYLHVREARYHSGKDKWWYALSVRKDPVVTSVFPAVVQPGSKVKLEPAGFNVETLRGREVDIPANAQGPFEIALGANLVRVGVTSLPFALEAHATPQEPITLPAGINGRIGRNDEVDRYRFRAKAGERFEFEVQARRWASRLDPLIEVRDVSGRLLEAQDDLVNTVGQTADGLAFPVDKDPRMEWIAPDDGLYEVDVRDANYFGGPEHHYFFSARRQSPDFSLVLDDDRMPVGPGESVTAVVTAERRNGFQGPIRLFVRGLPEGVVAHESVIPAHLDQANIVITAPPGARADARAIVVGGDAVAGEGAAAQKIERLATPFAPMGQAGGRTFLRVPSAMAAVVEGSDIIMQAEPARVTLQRGRSATIKIRLTRNNYAGPVEVNVILWNLMQRFSKLPAGLSYVEKESKTSLAPGESEAYVTFRADADAPPLDDYLMAVMGQITYNRVFMTRVAAPFRLSIE